MTEQLIDNVSTTETAGIVLFKKKKKICCTVFVRTEHFRIRATSSSFF